MKTLEGKSSPISTTVAAAVAAGLSVAVLSSWYIGQKWARGKGKEISSTQEDDSTAVPLLDLESGQTMFENVASISTLTWYKGNLETTVNKDAIKDRVAAILKANPWLCGHFKKRGSNGTVCLVYQEGGEAGEEVVKKSLDNIFTVVSSSSSSANCSELSRETPYEQLATILKPFLVGRGIDLLRDPSKPFLRISLIPDRSKPKERFALVFSLAHCVGDGYTFYTLHNMLDTNRPILTLNPKRKVHIIEKIEQGLGGPMYSSSLSNPPVGFILRFLKAMFVSSVFGPKTEVRLFWIDEEWIQREKALAQKELASEGYASTNDAVTARFFECTQVDEGIMALNFRGKINDCHEKDAGNYFNYLVCRPADYSTLQIRQAVEKIKQQIPLKRETKPLTTWEHLTSSSLYGATSNWSTFCKPVALPGCEEQNLLHVPVLPTDSISCPATFVTGLFLFRPGPSKRVAAMFAGHPKALKALEASGMMGGDVYST